MTCLNIVIQDHRVAITLEKFKIEINLKHHNRRSNHQNSSLQLNFAHFFQKKQI